MSPDHEIETAPAGSAALLIRDRESLALEVTTALFAESPALLERYGDIGRAKCLQDMRHNIDHLIPAVDLGDTAMFARYVQWLDDLLRARNVSTRDVVRCLQLLRERCIGRYAPEHSAPIAAVIDGGLAVVSDA